MFLRRKPEVKWGVVLDGDGFHSFFDDKLMHRVEWASVREVAAFKRDLFSYDEICLGFRTDEADAFTEVWESDDGFRELLAELPRHFPSIRTDSFREVAQPAFATNWTSLWGEPLQPQKT